MPKPFSTLPLAATLLWAVPGMLVVVPSAQAQTTPAPQALITAVQGATVTLAVGTEDGVQVGTIYEVRNAGTIARLQVTSTGAVESTATLLNEEGRAALTVGDTAVFVRSGTPAPGANNTATLTVPALAVIQSLSGESATLAIGKQDGAVVGAVYALPAEGGVRARFRIVRVGDESSTALVLFIEEGFTPTIGESARFIGIEAEPEIPAPSPIETTPGLPTNPAPTVVTAPANPGAQTVKVVDISTPPPATILQLEGSEATLTAGAISGATVGQTVPVLRGGSVIGLVKLTQVDANSSKGTVIWRDESQPAIAVGDALGVLNASTVSEGNGRVPAALVSYETGGSDTSVPKADKTYELLGALAATGLIKSQPARFFYDDGARRHNTAEDVVLSRSQIAGFISEALKNYDGSGNRSTTALSLLVSDYNRDLHEVGVNEDVLSSFTNQAGKSNFRFGFSTFTRATAVSGDTGDDAIAPFAERFGAARLKSGIDSRINLYGSVGSKLKFYSTIDTGSDIRDGQNTDGAQTPGNTSVRNAYLSYDASNLVRGLTINVGRKEYWWGTGTFGTTILGDAAGGLDSVNFIYNHGNLKYETLYASLGTGPAGGKRSLYGQNLSYRLGQQAKLGITTTILAPKDRLDAKLLGGVLLPIPLYAIDRLNQNGETTNAVVNGYGEVGVARGMRLYGEVVLDDFSLNQNNRIENRDGGLVGVQLFNPKNPGKSGLSFEYARLNATSYIIRQATQGETKDVDYNYYYRGAPLGYPIAPTYPSNFGGAESLRLDGYFKPLQKLTLFGGVEYSDLNAEDQNPAPSGGLGFSRQRIYRIGATYDVSRAWSLSARAMRVNTDQPDFVKGSPSVQNNYLSLSVARAF